MTWSDRTSIRQIARLRYIIIMQGGMLGDISSTPRGARMLATATISTAKTNRRSTDIDVARRLSARLAWVYAALVEDGRHSLATPPHTARNEPTGGFRLTLECKYAMPGGAPTEAGLQIALAAKELERRLVALLAGERAVHAPGVSGTIHTIRALPDLIKVAYEEGHAHDPLVGETADWLISATAFGESVLNGRGDDPEPPPAIAASLAERAAGMISAASAAARWGVGTDAITRAIRVGKLAPALRKGQGWWVDVKTVDAYFMRYGRGGVAAQRRAAAEAGDTEPACEPFAA